MTEGTQIPPVGGSVAARTRRGACERVSVGYLL